MVFKISGHRVRDATTIPYVYVENIVFVAMLYNCCACRIFWCRLNRTIASLSFSLLLNSVIFVPKYTRYLKKYTILCKCKKKKL